MTKLLPCPFCGNPEPYFERMGTPRQSCIVVCGNCGARHESGDENEHSGRSWNERAAPSAPRDAVSQFACGVDAAARLVEQRLADYDAEHGSTDSDTGAREYPGTGDEYVCELDEIAEAIRGLAPPAAQSEQDVDDAMVERACIAYSEATYGQCTETRREAMIRSGAMHAALLAALGGAAMSDDDVKLLIDTLTAAVAAGQQVSVPAERVLELHARLLVAKMEAAESARDALAQPEATACPHIRSSGTGGWATHWCALNGPPAAPEPSANERRLRRLLCIVKHGRSAYMDDGEAQDSSAHPSIDYLRDSLDEIEAKWRLRASATLTAPEPSEAEVAAAMASLYRAMEPAAWPSEDEVTDALRAAVAARGSK